MSTQNTEERLTEIIRPVAEDFGVELVDVRWLKSRLVVTIDHADGLGTDLLDRVTRALSAELDQIDPISSSYTLEVSSPGIERALRTPQHFVRSIGETVALKIRTEQSQTLRLEGKLVEADEELVTLDIEGQLERVDHQSIVKARTVFDWSKSPKPGSRNQRSTQTPSELAEKQGEQLLRSVEPPVESNELADGGIDQRKVDIS